MGSDSRTPGLDATSLVLGLGVLTAAVGVGLAGLSVLRGDVLLLFAGVAAVLGGAMAAGFARMTG